MNFRENKFKTLRITKLFDGRTQTLGKKLQFFLYKILAFLEWSYSKMNIIFILCIKELLVKTLLFLK